VQLWPVICPGLSAAPHVLAVGDLHVENFGTWRDREGRWIWGINDFDEAFIMAYTIDLVRLAVSALFCVQMKRLKNVDHVLTDKLLAGYADALQYGGDPIVLEGHPILFRCAATTGRDAVKYWTKLQNYPEAPDAPLASEEVKALLFKSMPEGTRPVRMFHRTAGLGSLGRARFVMLGHWRGHIVARECKPAVASSCYFAANQEGPYESRQLEIVQRSVRSTDPFFFVENGWIIRRLSPDSSKIVMDGLTLDEECELFYRMGWEVANVHLGSPHAIENVKKDLASRPKGWLLNASQLMKSAITDDYRVWRQHQHPPPTTTTTTTTVTTTTTTTAVADHGTVAVAVAASQPLSVELGNAKL